MLKENVHLVALCFLILEKFPTICPNCGSEVTTLLTNVSKGGGLLNLIKLKKCENVVEPSSVDNNESDVKIENILRIYFFKKT